MLIGMAAFVLINSMRSKGTIERALHMSLLLVTLPRDEEDSQKRQPKELIAVMEQLYAALTNIHSTGWNKFKYGEPYIALELSVHHVGEEIHFYIAVPRNFQESFEQQIHGLYPSATVEKIKDYNIFNPDGAVAGAYLKQTENPILSMRTYAQLESDPLGPILAALSKLEKEGEGATIQILLRPSHRNDIRKLAQSVAHEMQNGHDFEKALARAKKPAQPKKDEATVAPTHASTAFEQSMIEIFQKKASRPLYDCNIRILTSADALPRAEQILSDITNAFVQFTSPDSNSLEAIRLRDRALQELIFDFSFRIFNENEQVHLSSEELTSLYHFPIPSTDAPKVKALKSKMVEPPMNLPREGVIIGSSTYRGKEQKVRLTDSDRRRHVYIVGQTGTGKSSMMKNMILQDLREGKGVCVIDPHGELAEYVVSVVPPERADDVIYFNPGDAKFPMGLNLLEFDPTRPEQKTFVTNELLSVVKSIYKDIPDAFGPMFEQYFKNAILLLLDVFQQKFEHNGSVMTGIAHEMPTLADVPRVMTDAGYRKQLLEKETNPLVKNFWNEEAQKAGGDASLANMAPYITSKLSPFVTNDYLRPIVSQATSAWNFRKTIDGGMILVVNLAKGQIGEINASLLGMVTVGKLLMAALSRSDVSEDKRKDFYLYIDEFQSVTTDSIATILSEARKYKLNLTIAHQYIKQLREEIRTAVFGNVGSIVAFRVGAEDAEVLKSQFEPVFTVRDLINIDNFQAHAKLLLQNQPSRPFNLRTMKESEGKSEIAAALHKLSQHKYARPREDVEDKIKQNYQTPQQATEGSRSAQRHEAAGTHA
jgi:hypothetical protein